MKVMVSLLLIIISSPVSPVHLPPGPVRYHFRRLPAQHERGSATCLLGPHLRRHLHHGRWPRPHLCCWNRCHHPHQYPGPRCSGCQEDCSAQAPVRCWIDGIFFLFIAYHQIKIKTKCRNKKQNPRDCVFLPSSELWLILNCWTLCIIQTVQI